MVIKIFLWLMTSLTIIITLYLVLIYIISKSFRSYPCYLNIILSSIIVINNILRIIGIGEVGTGKCYFQAFTLAVTDKLFFSSLSINAFLSYIGVVYFQFYTNNIKCLFIILNTIALFISITFGLIFILIKDPVSYANVCYVDGNDYKIMTDIITTFCLYLLYLYCNIKLLLYIIKVIKELYETEKSAKNFSRHFYRILFSIIITTLSFLVVILIIKDSLFLDDDLIDLFYIIVCLIVDLFYTFNKTVIRESYKLFCKKRAENENNENLKKENDDDDNDNEDDDKDKNDKDDSEYYMED